MKHILKLTLLIGALAFICGAGAQTLDVSFVHTINASTQHYTLTGTANGAFNTGAKRSWGVSNITIRFPQTISLSDGTGTLTLTSDVAGGTTTPYITNIATGFTAFGYTDLFTGGSIAGGFTFYTLSDLGGTDDGYVYMTMVSGSSTNQSFASGGTVNILSFDVSPSWGWGGCPGSDCIEIVTTDPPGLSSQIYSSITNSGVNSGSTNVANFTTLTSALPVDLVSFTATKAGDCSAQLQWKTATETNSSKYVIEYSTGASFSEAASVASKNSSTGASYTYTLSNLSNGTAIFRLKMVDKDGAVKYSDNRSVSVACINGRIVVLQNPVKDKLTVSGMTGVNNVIRVYSMTGQLLASKVTGNAIETINAANYAHGSYLVVVTDAKGKTVGSVKVLK